MFTENSSEVLGATPDTRLYYWGHPCPRRLPPDRKPRGRPDPTLNVEAFPRYVTGGEASRGNVGVARIARSGAGTPGRRVTVGMGAGNSNYMGYTSGDLSICDAASRPPSKILT